MLVRCTLSTLCTQCALKRCRTNLLRSRLATEVLRCLVFSWALNTLITYDTNNRRSRPLILNIPASDYLNPSPGGAIQSKENVWIRPDRPPCNLAFPSRSNFAVRSPNILDSTRVFSSEGGTQWNLVMGLQTHGWSNGLTSMETASSDMPL